jgi:hypothetical protein
MQTRKVATCIERDQTIALLRREGVHFIYPSHSANEELEQMIFRAGLSIA